MIFAFDMDDTVTAMPEFFAVLAKALRADGHKIYIITARDEILTTQTEQFLSDQGIEYDGVYFTYDKQVVARNLGVDFAFDDMPLFYQGLTLPFRIIKVSK